MEPNLRYLYKKECIRENQQNLCFSFRFRIYKLKSGLLDKDSVLCIVLVFMLKNFLEPIFLFIC